MLLKEKLQIIEEFARKLLGEEFSHGYPHVERVKRIAYDIVEHVDVYIDRYLLTISVLLHDVGRIIGEPHAYYSALISRSYLADLGFNESFIDKVVNAILYHSYSYSRSYNIKPFSEEAKVLSDADKLDALGIIGFIRVFVYNAEKGSNLETIIRHFQEKILKLPSLMHYEYTRKKAEELRKRVVELLLIFSEESGVKIDIAERASL